MKEFLAQDGAQVMLTPKAKLRTLISTSVELSPEARCDDCDWGVGQRPSAQGEAMQHAQDTGHTVTLDEIRRTVVTAS